MEIYLAALDHNFDSKRGQDTLKSDENIGKYKYEIAWKKTTYKHAPRNVYQESNTEILSTYISKNKKKD